MNRSSPHNVSYPALVVFAQKALQQAEERYAGAKACGAGNLNALTHQIECGKALVRMLKKCEPGKQADMFQLFESVKK